MKEKFQNIIDQCIESVLPQAALTQSLKPLQKQLKNCAIVSIGKAGWQMAKTAYDFLNGQISCGIVLTKENHSNGPIGNFTIMEGTHPLVSQQNIECTEKIIQFINDLPQDCPVVFLISGGGSALLERPSVSLQKLQDVTRQLLNSHADIEEINIIRKRLSQVKGGKLAAMCRPRPVYNFILSDVVGGTADMIASGPTVNDTTTEQQAQQIIEEFSLNDLKLSETVRDLDNVTTCIIADNRTLAENCRQICWKAGYESTIVDDKVSCHLEELVKRIGMIARENQHPQKPEAFIFCGEITMQVTGNGSGGRCQHLALACSESLSHTMNTTLLAFGSDGTDGPTEAAGGYVTSNTRQKAREMGIDVDCYMKECDSYHCLKQLNQLIITGPTGTNVNDLYILFVE